MRAIRMSRRHFFSVTSASLLAARARAAETKKLSLLIVDGCNNHDWVRTTKFLREILEGSGRFAVTVSTSPAKDAPASDWEAWKPAFADYDVVVSDFNGGHREEDLQWPRALEASFENYVEGGGGVVIVHAANNSFLNWPAYNEMIGLGWRKKNFGPSIIFDDDGKEVRLPEGEGLDPGHGPPHDFQLTVRAPEHPIVQAMPPIFYHPLDQLSHGQHGPAKGMTILTSAWSKDSLRNEPMDWVVPYGKGRVYTTMQAHLMKNSDDTPFRCVGFQTLLIRGAEWAATGKVTYPLPTPFPGPDAACLGPPLE